MKKKEKRQKYNSIILKCCFLIFISLVLYNLFSSYGRVWLLRKEYNELSEMVETQKIQNEVYEKQLEDIDALLSAAAREKGYVQEGDQVYMIAN